MHRRQPGGPTCLSTARTADFPRARGAERERQHQLAIEVLDHRVVSLPRSARTRLPASPPARRFASAGGSICGTRRREPAGSSGSSIALAHRRRSRSRRRAAAQAPRIEPAIVGRKVVDEGYAVAHGARPGVSWGVSLVPRQTHDGRTTPPAAANDSDFAAASSVLSKSVSGDVPLAWTKRLSVERPVRPRWLDMCGIAGQVRADRGASMTLLSIACVLRSSTAVPTLGAFISSLESVWASSACGSSTSPPATSRSSTRIGTVAVVLNGEIYNFQELRRDLEAEGHRFRTQTDTETIVHLYERDGLDFVRRLHGMFGIALWDRTRRQLVLARDRVGKKPLFYAERDGALSFASELPALLQDAGVDRRSTTRHWTLISPTGMCPLRSAHSAACGSSRLRASLSSATAACR